MPHVIAKIANKLRWAIYKRLKALSPAKGKIREQMLARIRGGDKFLKVRASARDWAKGKIEKSIAERAARKLAGVKLRKQAGPAWKRNAQALAVNREIGMREQARVFTGVSALYKGFSADRASTTALSASGSGLSVYTFNTNQERTIARFGWGTLNNELAAKAAEAVGKPKAQQALTEAIDDVIKDTLDYKRFHDEFRTQFEKEMKAVRA